MSNFCNCVSCSHTVFKDKLYVLGRLTPILEYLTTLLAELTQGCDTEFSIKVVSETDTTFINVVLTPHVLRKMKMLEKVAYTLFFFIFCCLDNKQY